MPIFIQNQQTQNLISNDSILKSNSFKNKQSMTIFEIKENLLTHEEILRQIQSWQASANIQEKFQTWSFCFDHRKILRMAPHKFFISSIYYVFLKKMSLLISNFDQQQVVKTSFQLKKIYQMQMISHRLTGHKFDYLLLATVKLISLFFGSHTKQVIINNEFEAEVYAILIFVLLGTEVGQKIFFVLTDKYKSKRVIKQSKNIHSKKSRCFLISSLMSKQISDNKQSKSSQLGQTKLKICSKKKICLIDSKDGISLFHKLQNRVETNQYLQMKQLLRSNLVVKQFIPKPNKKQTLNEVLQKNTRLSIKLRELAEAKLLEKYNMKSKKLCYTQMSASMDIKGQNQSLNTLKSHSISIKPQKQAKFYKFVQKQTIKQQQKCPAKIQKLPIIQNPSLNQNYSYQATLQKKKQAGYWQKILEQMKENMFKKIQHFPPLNTKHYFNKEEFDEQKKFKTVDTLGEVNELEKIKENSERTDEYKTENAVESPCITKNLLNYATQPGLKRITGIKARKLSIKDNLQEVKDQINIIQYSTLSAKQEIYKKQQGFMNIYSNQPFNECTSNFKKKSNFEWKQIQKKYHQACQKRNQKIRNSYFS